jgi:hypothetical protein
MRPGGRVGLHRGKDGLLDQCLHLGRRAERQPAAVSHRWPHSQAALQSYDAPASQAGPRLHIAGDNDPLGRASDATANRYYGKAIICLHSEWRRIQGLSKWTSFKSGN